MKRIKIKYIKFLFLIIPFLLIASCEDYLDKSPESIINDEDIFTHFYNYQGFIEEMYNCIVDYGHAGYARFLFADEVISGVQHTFDVGNYWESSGGSGLFWGSVSTAQVNFDKRVWPLCWYGIRKANIALSKLDMFQGTKEERDVLEGQALFFRAWFHFELMRFWGGMPYIDSVLEPDKEYLKPRLSYKECALKVAEDFKKASELLPVDWDTMDYGQLTLGGNRQRISKIMAMAYQGKVLLFAASPLMNGQSVGNYSYDAELCKLAADIFGETINLCSTTQMFELEPWKSRTDNFYNFVAYKMTGGKEVIMNATPYLWYRTESHMIGRTLPKQLGKGNNGVISPEVPTHNYIMNYAMKNGLPIDDSESGFDPNDPWANREPRFYIDITIDGDWLTKQTAAGPDMFAQLYNNGRHRAGVEGSVTGYFYRKFSPQGLSQWDYNDVRKFNAFIPFLRLADVYLMYAESVLHGYGSPLATTSTSSLSALDALNVIRNRSQLPNLLPRYYASKEKFMEEIIRERAVELAFEGQRFDDLRRWNIADKPKFNIKTAINFDRGTNGKPTNIQENIIIKKTFIKGKHEWLPINYKDTKIFEGFQQNPGW